MNNRLTGVAGGVPSALVLRAATVMLAILPAEANRTDVGDADPATRPPESSYSDAAPWYALATQAMSWAQSSPNGVPTRLPSTPISTPTAASAG